MMTTTGNYPADLLDLSSWKLTVPVNTAQSGNPDEYKNPALKTLSLDPYFHLTAQKDGVVFQAHAGGATTGNSSYPRSELREMLGGDGAAWSTTSGKHTLKVREAITHVPTAKPHVVAAQIHDANDDVVMVRLEGKELFVEGDGDAVGMLDPNYVLGTVFTVEMVAENGTITVFYNGVQKAAIPAAATGCYFKAGCYTQSNTSKGDAADAYGQVVIYALELKHE